MSKCPQCRRSLDNVDDWMATFWNGDHWHRRCAVLYQQKSIVKLEKKLKSAKITQACYSELVHELDEAKADLEALKKIAQDERTDRHGLGSKLVRHGFGSRIDTHKLLEAGKITHKQVERAAEIKALYGDTK